MKALKGKILVTLLACLFVFGLITVSNVAYAVNVTVEYLTADYDNWVPPTTTTYTEQGITYTVQYNGKYTDAGHDYRIGRLKSDGEYEWTKAEDIEGGKAYNRALTYTSADGVKAGESYQIAIRNDAQLAAKIVGWRVNGISPDKIKVKGLSKGWIKLKDIYEYEDINNKRLDQRHFDWFRTVAYANDYYALSIQIPKDQKEDIELQAWFLEKENIEDHNHIPANSVDGNGKYYNIDGVHGYICYCGKFVPWSGKPQKASEANDGRFNKGKDYSNDANWKRVTCKDIADKDKKIISRHNDDATINGKKVKAGHVYECSCGTQYVEEHEKKDDGATGDCFCFARKGEGKAANGETYDCKKYGHRVDIDSVAKHTKVHAYTCLDCGCRISQTHWVGNKKEECWCKCYAKNNGNMPGHKFDGTGKCLRCTDVLSCGKAHSWENGSCTKCGIICTNHDWNEETQTCTVCGYQCTIHYYGGDDICDICGFDNTPAPVVLAPTPHTCKGETDWDSPYAVKKILASGEEYMTGWLANETHHWVVCLGCKAKGVNKVVSALGVIGGKDENGNEIIAEAVIHKWDLNGTGVCITCGYEHTGCKGTGVNSTNNNKNNGWFANGTHHWVECEVCHRHMQAYYNNNKELGQTPGEVAHYDGGKDGKGKKDGKCDACLSPIGHECVGTVGGKWAGWKANDSGHWVECAVCKQPKKGLKGSETSGAKAYDTSIVEHNWEKQDGTCKTCGWKHEKCVGTNYGPYTNNGWYIDGANGHYTLCKCGNKMQGCIDSPAAISKDNADKPGPAPHKMENGKCRYCFYESNKVTVTYDLDGGKNGPPTVGMKKGSSYTINSIIPVNAGYNFKGWKDATGKTYKAGDKIVVEKNLVLRAIWENQTAKLHYDANGGENAPADDYLVVGMSTSIKHQVPTREGFKFVCWTTEKDGTGDSYKFGDRLVTVENKDVTLYAKWESKNGTAENIGDKGCQHVYGDKYGSDDTYHWAKCTLCGEIGNKEEHKRSALFNKCTVCGAQHIHKGGNEWKIGAFTHWVLCEECGTRVTGPSSSVEGANKHEFDSNGKCRQCGYVKK